MTNLRRLFEHDQNVRHPHQWLILRTSIRQKEFDFIMKFMTHDHVRLDYSDTGGDGQPVVLLTGIGGAKEIWRDQLTWLQDLGYRVLALDARNQGASQHTVKGRRISRHAIDLHDFLTGLELTQPILIGNSMGAATLFAYVSLFGDADLAAIVDVDQSPKMISDETWAYGFNDLTWETFPSLLKFPLGPATATRINDQTYADVKQVEAAHPYDADLNLPFLLDHAFQDWRDIVAQLHVPFFVIAGEKPPYFNPKFAAVTAQLAPHGQSTVISNAGHIVLAEQPHAFNQALGKFLQTL